MYNICKEELKMKVRELLAVGRKHCDILIKEDRVARVNTKDDLDREIDYIECASIIEHTLMLHLKP